MFGFEDAVADLLDLNNIFDKKYASQIKELVDQRFKPRIVEVTGVLELSSYEGNGLEIVQKCLDKVVSDRVDIKYLGGGKYKVTIEAPEYKEAEKLLKEAIDSATDFMDKNKGTIKFNRK